MPLGNRNQEKEDGTDSFLEIMTEMFLSSFSFPLETESQFYSGEQYTTIKYQVLCTPATRCSNMDFMLASEM